MDTATSHGHGRSWLLVGSLLVVLALSVFGGPASAQVSRVSSPCPTDYSGVTVPGCVTTGPGQGSAPTDPATTATSTGTVTSTVTTSTSSGTLAFTGANVLRALLVAFVLILVGLVLTSISRERRKMRH